MPRPCSQGDIRACTTDFKRAFGNFSAAFNVLHDSTAAQSGDFPFRTDLSSIKAGIKDLGYGLIDVSKGVSDCHLAELAEILSKLATQLGIVPEVRLPTSYLELRVRI